MVSTTDVVVEQPEIANEKMENMIGEEEFEKAQKTFQQGKKHLLLNKFDEAVTNIGDACKVFSTKYGEMDQHCAEIYYFYGKALLELARVENTVLGNALNGVPEETEPINDSRYGNPEDVAAEEKKEISEKVIDAMCESEDGQAESKEEAKTEDAKASENGESKTEEKKELNGEEEKEKNVEEKKASEEVTTESEEKKENGNEEEGEGGEDEVEGEDDEEEVDDLTKNEEQIKDEAEAEDISNLQRSWEMFELAKLVYSKNYENDPEFKSKRIAECLMKLGEISIEQELYEQAITDINESIKLQEEAKERDERMLAESFYQLGLAYQFNAQFQEAKESYDKSTNILQLRIDKLKGLLEQTTDELEKNPLKEEISELEALLPEMLAKLEEVGEQGQQSINLIKEAKECFINSINDKKPTTNETSEVKDITSLVKSKRKASGSDQTNGNKKSKIEGEETTNGHSNDEPIETDEPKENKEDEKMDHVENKEGKSDETVENKA